MTVNVSQEVMDRVNNELFKAIVETPEYIQKIVTELLAEPEKDRWGSASGPNLFERTLRNRVRDMLEQSIAKVLREQYADQIEKLTREALEKQEKLDGTLAMAFANMIKEDYKLRLNVSFEIIKD